MLTYQSLPSEPISLNFAQLQTSDFQDVGALAKRSVLTPTPSNHCLPAIVCSILQKFPRMWRNSNSYYRFAREQHGDFLRAFAPGYQLFAGNDSEAQSASHMGKCLFSLKFRTTLKLGYIGGVMVWTLNRESNFLNVQVQFQMEMKAVSTCVDRPQNQYFLHLPLSLYSTTAV